MLSRTDLITRQIVQAEPTTITTIGVARECRGCRCTPPRATEKIFLGNFIEMRQNGVEVGDVYPADETKKWVVAIYDYGKKAMTKKVIRFLVKKSAPPEKILATPMITTANINGYIGL